MLFLLFSGEMSIFYLYVVGEFNWTYTKYGLYNTYRFLVNIVGGSSKVLSTLSSCDVTFSFLLDVPKTAHHIPSLGCVDLLHKCHNCFGQYASVKFHQSGPATQNLISSNEVMTELRQYINNGNVFAYSHKNC